MDALKNFVRTRAPEFLQIPNVTSVGVGYKVVAGRKGPALAISFTVAKKAKPEQLEALGTEKLPASFNIGGVTVPTDVQERKYAPSFRIVSESLKDVRKRRLDPIVPGISVANTKVSAGTIGCIVFDRQSGSACILSNWHVLNGPDGLIGDAVVQPGPFDDNRVSENAVGVLLRSHLGPAGDCAVARIQGRTFGSEILDLAVVPKRLGEPELGDKVVKSGRTTSVTHGIVSRVHVTSKIDYEGTVGEVEVGGFEIEPDASKPPSNGEVSMGGDSGSVWLFKNKQGKPTDIIAGLHFAGETEDDPHEHALACYSTSVFEKLDITLAEEAPAPLISTTLEAVPRRGFDTRFLAAVVPTPRLSSSLAKDSVKLDGEPVIPYTHFSLVLSRSKKFARWVAWNIDGSQIKKFGRKGLDFEFDPRLADEVQTGNILYDNNRLDRGHVARRADLVWGTPAEAKQANRDSFFFTNITPQMDNFNQGQRGGLWGRLEDLIFDQVDVDNLRVSVIGGPIFTDDDTEFRGSQIPRNFWKILVYFDAAKAELRASAFVLEQRLAGLEAIDLSPFRQFQVVIEDIESRTGLDFTVLRTADHFKKQTEDARRSRRAGAEAIAEARAEIQLSSDIAW